MHAWLALWTLAARAAPVEWPPDQTIDAPAARYALFGTDVSRAGDLDADGFSDVILCGTVLRGDGGCVVVPGGPQGLDAARQAELSAGDPPTPLFGAYPVGDMTGDGVDDLASLGVPVLVNPDSFALVYQGAAGVLPSAPSFRLDAAGETPIDPNVGAAPGDVDGDGLGDLCVLPLEETRLVTWPGGQGGPGAGVILELPEIPVGANGGGDLDGDGYADLLLRSCVDDHLVERALFGSPAGLTRDREQVIERTSNCGLLAGSSVAIVGDMNGDGYDDAAFGLPPEGGLPRQVELRLGGPAGLEAAPAALLVSGQSNDSFGTLLAGAGDLDGDGLHDLAVSATTWAQANGRVYVFFGAATGAQTEPGLMVTGVRRGLLGTAVRGAGDVNGDGFDDLLIGEPGNIIQPGVAYVIAGQPFDEDGDGVRVDLDCRDNKPAIHPGATEEPANGTDEDCDGLELCYTDADGDGARSAQTEPTDKLDCAGRTLSPADDPLDCDDADGDAHPGATDTPGDGIDQDCDGADAIAEEPEPADDTDAPGDPEAVDDKDEGCACASAPRPGWLAAALLLTLRRRRR